MQRSDGPLRQSNGAISSILRRNFLGGRSTSRLGAFSYAEMINSVPENAGRLSILYHYSLEGPHGQGKCPSSSAVLVFRTRMSAPPASFLYIVVALQDRSLSSPAPIPIDESGLAGVGGGPPGQDFIDDGASKLLALCHGTGSMTSSSLLMSGVLVHTLFAASCSQWDLTGRLTSKDAERRSPPI